MHAVHTDINRFSRPGIIHNNIIILFIPGNVKKCAKSAISVHIFHIRASLLVTSHCHYNRPRSRRIPPPPAENGPHRLIIIIYGAPPSQPQLKSAAALIYVVRRIVLLSFHTAVRLWAPHNTSSSSVDNHIDRKSVV